MDMPSFFAHRKLLSQAILCCALCVPPAIASSLNEQLSATHSFSIPAQPLAEALIRFAQQANIQVSVDDALLNNINSAAVSGSQTSSEALELLLRNTGLRWRSGSQGLFLEPIPQDSSKVQLPRMTVVARYRPDMQIMNAEQISREPTRNGNITELLRLNPNVQFNASSNSGLHAGEIAPAYVSIHGQPFYSNNFTVDGLSNNDIMNPGASDGVAMSYSDYVNNSSGSIPPGNPESFYVDSSLVKELRVFDSNVPAKYSQFTGGVIDADLKAPDLRRASGSIRFRTTRDNWTRIHEDKLSEDPIDGDATRQNSGQPEFIKRSYHFDINQPLGERSALLFSYDRTESKIPKFQPVLGSKENERRLSETFLLKGLFEVDERNKLITSLMYSPHENLHIPTNSVRDGKMTISGGGWQAFADWEHRFDAGVVNTKLSFSSKTNRREWENSERFIQHNNAPASLGWCSSSVNAQGNCTAREGGFPEDYSEHITWGLKQDWAMRSFLIGSVEHQIDWGWQAEVANVRYKRVDDHITDYSNQFPQSDLSGCFDCNPEEGWSIVRRVVYPKTDTKVGVNQFGLYVSDRIGIERLTLTPGVRIDYDEFLKNTNVAPRFAFNVDIFHDGKTNVFGGANRYYAGNMVYYAMRAALPSGIAYGATSGANRRKPTQQWEDTKASAVNTTRYDSITSLKTPYSDELNIGWSQQWGNQLVTLKHVYREGKDQFKQSRGEKNERFLTNEGHSRSNTTSLQFGNLNPYELGLLRFNYRFGAKYFETRNNNRYAYDNISNEELFDWMAIIDGKLMRPDEIPALDFNQPWSAFVEFDTDLPAQGLSWTHRINYADGYTAYLSKPVNCANAAISACGDYRGRAYAYSKRDFKDALTIDWRISLTIPTHKQQHLELTLDVLNVLDNKVGANVGSGVNGSMSSSGFASGYETGRQLWLGASYTW